MLVLLILLLLLLLIRGVWFVLGAAVTRHDRWCGFGEAVGVKELLLMTVLTLRRYLLDRAEKNVIFLLLLLLLLLLFTVHELDHPPPHLDLAGQRARARGGGRGGEIGRASRVLDQLVAAVAVCEARRRVGRCLLLLLLLHDVGEAEAPLLIQQR